MGFSPGKTAPRGIALKGRPRVGHIPKDNVRRKRLDGVSEAHEALPDTKICGDARYLPSMSRSHSEFPQNTGAPADLLQRRQHAQSDAKGTEPLHITAYIYVVANPIRTPFQGDFLVRVIPRAEALGSFLFARRALGTRTRKCPNSSVPPGPKAIRPSRRLTIILALMGSAQG